VGAGKSEAMFEELALLAPTIVPEDERGVIRFGIRRVGFWITVLIERKVEMLNIFLVGPYVVAEPNGRGMNNTIDTLL
jgi:hypothetical protein